MSNITPEEAQDFIKKGAIVIDVRTKGEYNEGYIENAINIDFHDPLFETKIKELSKDKQYLIHCQSGGRSAKATDIMEKLGFTVACNILGGVSSWKSKGFPVKVK